MQHTRRAWPAVHVAWRTRKEREGHEVPVGRLWPSATPGLLPNVYCQEALQIFTLLNGWGKAYFVTTGNSNFSVPIQNVIATQPHSLVYTVSVCFSSTMAELHRGDGGSVTLTAKHMYCLALYRSFLIAGLRL